MIKQSLWSSLIASKLASKFLKENGLLTLTGAKGALEPTPGTFVFGHCQMADLIDCSRNDWIWFSKSCCSPFGF